MPEYSFSIISSFLCSFISQFLTIRSASGHHNGSDENGRIYNLTSMKLAVVHAQPCESIQRIVFLKTHKTASTTSASLFQRYGYYRNLTFAVGRNHILSFSSKFSRRNVLNFPGMRGKPFDILANHARYNRGEMDLVVPNATYVTIIRRPEDQLESAFGYFEMYRGMNLSKDDNPLQTFMENPMKYYENHKYHMWQLSRNGQLFDLGLDRQMQENKSFIEQFINQIDKDFDLVMISEYYDESLVLMKKLLCWNFEDILYIPAGVRSTSHRYLKDESLVRKMQTWNMGDVMLYNHFNQSLWKKIDDYGATFYTDLETFRGLNHAVFKECISPNKTDGRDRREKKYVLKNGTERCSRIIMADVNYTPMIRTSMIERFGLEKGSWES